MWHLFQFMSSLLQEKQHLQFVIRQILNGTTLKCKYTLTGSEQSHLLY